MRRGEGRGWWTRLRTDDGQTPVADTRVHPTPSGTVGESGDERTLLRLGEGEEGLATEAPRVVERAELGAARVVPGRRRGGVRGVPGGAQVDQSDESRDGAGVAAWLGSCARGGREEERERQQGCAAPREGRHREGARGGVAPEAAPRGSPAVSPFPRVPRVRGGKKRTPAVGGCRGVRPIVT